MTLRLPDSTSPTSTSSRTTARLLLARNILLFPLLLIGISLALRSHWSGTVRGGGTVLQRLAEGLGGEGVVLGEGEVPWKGGEVEEPGWSGAGQDQEEQEQGGWGETGGEEEDEQDQDQGEEEGEDQGQGQGQDQDDEMEDEGVWIKPGQVPVVGERGLVTCHFMLGNTYPYTDIDWETQLQLAGAAGIDAFALNLGPEDWQTEEARSAYRVASRLLSTATSSSRAIPRLFLSLDMNVLPSASKGDMRKLVALVKELAGSEAQFRVRKPVWEERGTKRGGLKGLFGRKKGERAGAPMLGGEEPETARVVVSTFSGHDAEFGMQSWYGFLETLRKDGVDVYFIPGFFIPPQTLLALGEVDAAFSWNSAWPMEGLKLDPMAEKVFTENDKPYMAAISPWFFTHYGKEPPWNWNKNWIYPSDDNLYVNRWNQILAADFRPEFVQIISWNDYGESHYIGPIAGAQPGSEMWTDHRPHEAWLEMTKWFARRYKGLPNTQKEKIKVYLSYRTQPTDLDVPADDVGKPERSQWARDLVAVTMTFGLGFNAQGSYMHIEAGGRAQLIPLRPRDEHQSFSIPFSPGKVKFEIYDTTQLSILKGRGPDIEDSATLYNYNAWTGFWASD